MSNEEQIDGIIALEASESDSKAEEKEKADITEAEVTSIPEASSDVPPEPKPEEGVVDNIPATVPEVARETSPVPSVQSLASGGMGEASDTPSMEEPLTPATDRSDVSKSQSGSGRVTPASQSDQSLSFSSSEKSTPNRKKKQGEYSGRQIEFDQSSSSSGSVKLTKLPNRVGISWRKGERLEAMDYLHKWFPAKIREINEEDMQVLIHFDGWNQRFDEWVDMASDRIRPLMRHSERKDKTRRLKLEHKVGEQVYAKWTDCKMYPAKITSVLPNGSYEVIFYDGFKKQVQPINLRPMPNELQKKAFDFQPLPEKVPKKARGRRDKDISKSPGSAEVMWAKSGEKMKSERKRSSSSEGKVRHLKKTKLAPTELTPDTLTPQTQGGETVGIDLSVVKSEPVSTQTEYAADKAQPMETQPSTLQEPAVDTSQGQAPDEGTGVGQEPAVGPNVAGTQPPPVTSAPAPVPVQPHVSLYGPPVLPPKAFVVESDHNRYKCQYEGCNKGFRKEHLLDYHHKYYHIDGGAAPPQPQAKKRRKTLSTCSTESDSTPGSKKSRKKRNQSISEASSPLDHQFVIKREPDIGPPVGTSSKLLETGEISTQTTPIKTEGSQLLEDVKREIKLEISQDSNLTEESSVTDAEEYLKPDELVNCICDFYEENGLMIQCEVCMCWQHASCFGITDRTLPKTYVCFVCENPPGVRESSRYLHEQDWLKLGEIATFNYLTTQQPTEERCSFIKTTNSLVTDLQKLNNVLHSLKLQLKILKTKDESKIKLWRMDWDVVESLETSSVSEDPRDDTLDQTKGDDKTDVPDVIDSGKEGDSKEGFVDAAVAAGARNESEGADTPAGSDAHVGASKGEVLELVNEANGTELHSTNKEESVDTHTPVDNEEIKSGTESKDVLEATEGKAEETSAEGASGKTNESDDVEKSEDVQHMNVDGDKDQQVAGDQKDTKSESDSKQSAEATEVKEDEEKLEEKANNEKVPVAQLQDVEQEEGNHSDSTESVVEDQIEVCEKNLISHILRVEAEIADRMDRIEEQLNYLEAVEADHCGRELPTKLTDMPSLKKSIRNMTSDLIKVKKMSVFH